MESKTRKVFSEKKTSSVIDDIGVEIIAMHLVLDGGKTKSIPTRFSINLVGILFVFPPI